MFRPMLSNSRYATTQKESNLKISYLNTYPIHSAKVSN
jgi:hypothetical protein